MASTINAKTTGVGGIDASGDASGVLALQTGGTTALTIDSSQNVGIGTSSPYSQLDVYSTITSPTLGEASGVGTIRITNGSGALTSAGGLEFKIAGDTNGYGSKIQALNSGGSQLVFANRNASATWIERMRIDSTGQQSSTIVGYGTYNEYKCRAWVNFNGTGTVAIRASGNVSSITDNGVGDYTVNFTTALPDANYSAVGYSSIYLATSPSFVILNGSYSAGYVAQTTTTVRVSNSTFNGSAAFDPTLFTVAIFR